MAPKKRPYVAPPQPPCACGEPRMTGGDTCVRCAGLDFPCERCGLLIQWNMNATCEYCQEEIAKELARRMTSGVGWWHLRRQQRRAA